MIRRDPRSLARASAGAPLPRHAFMTVSGNASKMSFLFIDGQKGSRLHGADFSRGVGGVASAVILSAEILAAHEHTVTVASDIEGRSHHGGVEYVPYRDALTGGPFDAV